MSYYAVIANTFKNPPYTASFNCGPQNSNGGNSVCPTSIANTATVEYGAQPGGNSQVAPFPNPNGVGQGGLLFQAALPIPAIDVTSVTAPASCPVGAVASSAGCAAPTAPGGPGNPYAAFAGQVSAVWPNYPTPYLEQFNLQLQKEYKGNVVQIGYVGELGRHNGGNVNISGNPGTPNFGGISNNQESLILKTAGVGGTPLANPLAGQYPWLQHGVINPLTAWGTASYHALQVSFVRRFQRGLTVNVNYTWAHALAIGYGPCQPAYSPAQLGFGTGPKYVYSCFYDNVKSPSTPIIENQWGHGPGQLGNTLFDLRNRVSGTINYALPFGSSMTGIEGAIVKGWSVNLAGSWQSGAPFGVTNGAPFGGTNADGSSVVGGGLNQTCSGNYAKRSLQQWFNPACFSQPTINTFGTMDGSQLHGPSQRNVDFSLFKEFPVKERLRMQFRTEVFNLFNTPNFATPSTGIPAFSAAGVGLARRPTDLTGLNAGAITSKTVGAEPREIQFALKLLF